MQKQELLLHISTSEYCNGARIGDMVHSTGKKMLWSTRAGSAVDVVVIHYMSAVERYPDDPYRLEYIIAIFCEYRVSTHYLIDRTGNIFQLVPEQYKAWHCGGSLMPPPDSRQNVNEFSIGIELLATPESGFTEEQYAAAASLCCDIERRGRRRMTYIGHEDVSGKTAVTAGLRKDVKVDPGPLFDWKKFHQLVDRHNC